MPRSSNSRLNAKNVRCVRDVSKSYSRRRETVVLRDRAKRKKFLLPFVLSKYSTPYELERDVSDTQGTHHDIFRVVNRRFAKPPHNPIAGVRIDFCDHERNFTNPPRRPWQQTVVGVLHPRHR